MLLETPILVPFPDWKKSAETLKWLNEEDFLSQLELVVGALIKLAQQENRTFKVETEFRFDRQLLKNFNPQLLDMWRGYEWHLAMYGMYLANSFKKHSRLHEIWHTADVTWVSKACQIFYLQSQQTCEPYWFGTEFVHNSHQCWLVRNDPYYKHTFGTKIDKSASLLPVVWPPHERAKVIPVMRIRSANIK